MAALFRCLSLWPKLKSEMDQLEAAAGHRHFAHSFRFFGLVFILPGIVGLNLPSSFAVFAAYGTLTGGVLAHPGASHRKDPSAFLVFRRRTFNLVGATDIIFDYYHAIQVGLPAMAGQLGATYAIPIVYVPLLMITHVAAFYLLMRAPGRQGAASVVRQDRSPNWQASNS